MDKLQRIAQQRVLARESLGKLKAVSELFGVENGYKAALDESGFTEWDQKIAELEAWIFGESPIA